MYKEKCQIKVDQNTVFSVWCKNTTMIKNLVYKVGFDPSNIIIIWRLIVFNQIKNTNIRGAGNPPGGTCFAKT